MSTTDNESGSGLAGDLLYGADAIRVHLVALGLPEDTDVYYLRRARKWPIGKDGAYLIASKKRLERHAQRITAA